MRLHDCCCSNNVCFSLLKIDKFSHLFSDALHRKKIICPNCGAMMNRANTYSLVDDTVTPKKEALYEKFEVLRSSK
jgi:hypothetical protein